MAEPLRALSIAFFSKSRLIPASGLDRFRYGPFPRRSARAAARVEAIPGVARPEKVPKAVRGHLAPGVRLTRGPTLTTG